MKKSNNSIALKIFTMALTLGLISFAFIHSSMPADISSIESESVASFLEKILRFFGFNAELTELIVRKFAHFLEFSAIGVALVSTAYSFDRKRPHTYYFQVLFFGLFSAVIDEAIQLNVAGRSGQITDVLLDFSGILTGSLLMLAIFAIYRKIRKI